TGRIGQSFAARGVCGWRSGRGTRELPAKAGAPSGQAPELRDYFLPEGAAQLVAYVQSLKAFLAVFGADGRAMTRLFASTSCTCSATRRSADAPFTVAFVNFTVPRFGIAAR